MNLKTTFMQPVAERIRETCSFRKAYEVSAEREALTHRRWHTKAERVLRTLSSCRGSCHRSSDAWRRSSGALLVGLKLFNTRQGQGSPLLVRGRCSCTKLGDFYSELTLHSRLLNLFQLCC